MEKLMRMAVAAVFAVTAAAGLVVLAEAAPGKDVAAAKNCHKQLCMAAFF
ncbi:hypothetical protein [Hyphococcus sp.]